MVACGNEALEKLNLPLLTPKDYARFSGAGVEGYVHAILDAVGDKEHKYAKVFWEYYTDKNEAEQLDLIHPYEGVRELLSALKEKGIRLAVLSNKKHEATSAIIRHHFPDTFDVVLGEGGDVVKKPDTSGFAKILRELDISDPETVLYVGDSEIDVMTVKNARCRGVFVSWGFRTKEQLISAKADIILCSVSHLEDHIYNSK
jgi:phosphoglycolate phosphatase